MNYNWSYCYRLHLGVYHLYRFNSPHTRRLFIEVDGNKWKKELPARLLKVIGVVEWLPYGNYAERVEICR